MNEVTKAAKETDDQIATRILLTLSNSEKNLSLLLPSNPVQPSTPLFGNSPNSSIVNSPTAIFGTVTTPLFGSKATPPHDNPPRVNFYGDHPIAGVRTGVSAFEAVEGKDSDREEQGSPVTFRPSLGKGGAETAAWSKVAAVCSVVL